MNPKTYPPADERKAALGIFEAGGGATITTESEKKPVSKLDDLPTGDFKITNVWIDHTKPPKKKFNDLSALGGLTHLTGLSLGHMWVTDAQMDAFGSLPALESFVISYSGGTFTGAKLALLPAPEKMKTLGLAHFPIGAKGAATIGRCTQLERLSLAGSLVNDKDLAHISKLTALIALDLRGTPTTTKGLSLLKPCTNITSLGWSPYAKKGKADFQELAVIFPGVTHFNLGGREKITADDVAGLAAFPLLRHVHLESSAQATWGGLAKMPALERISTYRASAVDADMALLAASTSLLHLDFDSDGFSGPGLAHLAKIKSLSTLRVSHCGKVKDADIEVFKTARPDVKLTFIK